MSPVFRDLRPSSGKAQTTRLVIGPQQDPVPSSIDEIFFRTSESTPVKSYRVWVENQGLRLTEEEDLAAAESNPSPVPAASLDNGSGGRI